MCIRDYCSPLRGYLRKALPPRRDAEVTRVFTLTGRDQRPTSSDGHQRVLETDNDLIPST